MTSIALAPLHAQENLGAIRNVSTFDQLKIAGPFDVTLSPDRVGSIQIDADQEMLDKIITEVKNGALIIRMKKRSYFSTNPWKTIAIDVPMPNLRAIHLSGSGKVHNTTAFSTDNLEVKLAGSGSITLLTNATNVNSQLSGSGTVKMKGTTTQINVKLAGSGHAKLQELKAKNGQAELSGSGSIRLQCSENLTAKIAGSGTIRYYGEPAGKLHSKVTGSGSVRKAN